MKKEPKNAEKYICEKCDYKCSKQCDYNRHIMTSKHQNRTNLNNLEPKNATPFTCKNCNKCYKARNSMWYHQQKCKPILDTINNMDK